MPMLLQGRVALVTGAGRGAGLGNCPRIGSGRRARVRQRHHRRRVGSFGFRFAARWHGGLGRCTWTSATWAEFQSVVDQVAAQWGRLDVVVQNAVYMPLLRFEDMSPELWWRQLHVSLGGLFNAIRSSWNVMKAQGRRAHYGDRQRIERAGIQERSVLLPRAKHGQEGMIKALALEAAPYQIALNTMGPGKRVKPTDVTWAQLDAMPAEQKAQWADPVELGKAFVWLAAPAAQPF